ncbi:molecular chaperone [Citrobacter sp. JGM124]|uniref:TorD/DmsD family molecular chaperone n=1 Tax=Citrobacter sp. JGM124 TaxID=2799789 RepID=UPI001BA6FE08|nr:molecular chaperone [Citrobacter sp. JGM124]MBS0846905.1 molecular chaperone [Citrobacter sp. JGM124]
MNEFSVICRILGSLFYRQPQDPLLGPLFTVIREGKLASSWPLEQEDLIVRLQENAEPSILEADYHALFIGNECHVSLYRSAWQADSNEQDIRQFLEQRGMPLSDAPADSFGGLLLAASWLEDQSSEDESEAQIALFDHYILPWAGSFLGKVEACSTTTFYRTLAIITREAIQAMRDELQETEDNMV